MQQLKDNLKKLITTLEHAELLEQTSTDTSMMKVKATPFSSRHNSNKGNTTTVSNFFPKLNPLNETSTVIFSAVAKNNDATKPMNTS